MSKPEFTIGEVTMRGDVEVTTFDPEIFDTLDEACCWAECRSAQERSVYIVNAIASAVDLARYVAGERVA